jgi:stage II sporulation protein E
MSVICGAQNGMRRCRLFFVTQERVQLLTGMVGVGRLADEPSGDTCEMITLPQGRTAILVSDGMGCGKEASDDSAEAITLLKELLVAGFDAQTAVKTVNSLLLLRKDRERFPTADVLIINKYTGEADFIKLGTPPSFIKRQSEVIVIKDDTLPLGALAEVGSEPIRIPLENDDYIVMMTDGAIDIPEERLPSGHTKESWVRSRIRLFSGNSPQALAEHLLEMAMRLSGRTLRDDMTVIAVKIKTVSRIG